MATARVTACAAFLKLPAFTDEHEVRIIALAGLKSASVGIKATNFGMTPFVAVRAQDKGKTFIHEVRIGPGSSDRDTALYGLRRAVKKYGYENLLPRSVPIPYR